MVESFAEFSKAYDKGKINNQQTNIDKEEEEEEEVKDKVQSFNEFSKAYDKSKTSDQPKEDIPDPRIEEAKSYLSLYGYDTTPPVPEPVTEEKPVPIDTVSTILGDVPVYENQEDNQAQALDIAASYGYVPPPEIPEAKITEDDFDVQGTDGKLTELGKNWRSSARVIYENEGSPEVN